MKAILKHDIIGIKHHVYGKRDEKVTIVKKHINMVLVENDKKEKYYVNERDIQEIAS